jgi:hypothetical protein
MLARKSVLVLGLLLLALSLGFSQAVLSPSANTPVVDGVIAKGEYSIQQAVGQFWLGVNLSKDGKTLNVGVAAKANGWISIGLGSMKMNGSYIVIGYDKDGKQTISEDIGKGHGHSPSGVKKVTSAVVKSANGVATIEYAIPADEWIKTGKLQLILGAGKAFDLVSWHPLAMNFEATVKK